MNIKAYVKSILDFNLICWAIGIIICTTSCEDTDEQDELTMVTADTVNIDTVDTELMTLIEDMSAPHVARPNGVPASYGWAINPRIGYGNSPPEGWNAMIPWGQVYIDEEGTEAQNVRFQIKNLQTWYLNKKDGIWKEWKKTSSLDGANYSEDFVDDENITADIRDESSNGGGISATLPVGYNFHFWTDSRVTINPDDIAAVWAGVDARLILDDPLGPDDLDDSRLMMSVGSDYWLSLTAPWDDLKTNGDIFIGRFRYITREWDRFHAHTLTDEQIEKGPLPPFRLNEK